MLEYMSREISTILEKTPAGKYLVRLRVYRGTCIVADFKYAGYAFKFDITPLAGGRVTVDLVKKSLSARYPVFLHNGKKQNLSKNILLEEALGILERRVVSIVSQIDAESSPASAAVQGTPAKQLKIGLMTLPLNKNFGGNLQIFALMEKLKQMGHQPVIINRKHPPEGFFEDPESLSKDSNEHIMAVNYGMPDKLQNASFVNTKLLPVTRPFYSSAQLAKNIDKYNFDAVVVGSDQVWRSKYARTIAKDFFFDFLSNHPKPPKRISYAASFGAAKMGFDRETTDVIHELIQKFDAVLVREDSAVDLCRLLGVDAQHVLDPTLLLQPADYLKLFDDRKFNQDQERMLAYVLDTDPDKAALINTIQSALGLQSYATNGLPIKAENALTSAEGDRSVEGWLASFYGAKFIVTDSFHGAAFAILFNRPFIAYGNPKRGMARFTSLLRMFALEERLVVNAGDADLEKILKPIDWNRVNERLDYLRIHSLKLLNKALTDGDRTIAGVNENTVWVNQVAKLTLFEDQANDIDGKGIVVYQTGNSLTAERKSSLAPRQPFTIKDVVSRDICIGCGACSIATDGHISIVVNDKGMHTARMADLEVIRPELLAKADAVCPFSDNAANEDSLGAPQSKTVTMPIDKNVGQYLAVMAGRVNDKRQIIGSSSGGLTSWVLKSLLSSGRVDGVIHVGGNGSDARMFNYQVSFSVDDVDRNRKSIYYSTTLTDAFKVVKQHPHKTYALVGVPCFIKSARLLAHNDAVLNECLKYFVGIVCGHMKSSFFAESNAWQLGVPPKDLKKVDFRVKIPGKSSSQYNFAAEQGTDDPKKLIRTSHLVGGSWGHNFFQPNACNYCDDVFAETADVVLGDAWLPKYSSNWLGTNIIIARNHEIVNILEAGNKSGAISIENISLSDAIKSQGGGLRHRRAGLSVRLQDDIDQGLPVPMKRIGPGQLEIPESRKLVIRQRRHMAMRSFDEFIFAKKTGDLDSFKTRMGEEIAVYNYLDDHKYPFVDPAAPRRYDVALFGRYNTGNQGEMLSFFALHQMLKEIGLSVIVVQHPSQTAIDHGYLNNHKILKKYYKYSVHRPLDKLHELRSQCAKFVLAPDQFSMGQAPHFHPEYELLGAGDSSVKRISIATSLGVEGTNFPTERSERAIASYLLRQLDHVSTREPNGVKVFESVGVAATQILDPIFLCPQYVYEELRTTATVAINSADYVLGYISDIDDTLVKFFLDTVSKRIKVSDGYFMTTIPGEPANESKIADLRSSSKISYLPDANLADFVAAVSRASFVYTDSFHGACIATIFRKPFICAPKDSCYNAIFSLFSMFGLGDRIVQREALDPENVDRPIDWDHVHIKINEKRELAFNWLSKAFETDFDALAKVFYTSGENGNQKVNT